MYERYLELKKKKNAKDADVARSTGISKSTLSDWKAGRATPKADKLEKIARFFGVSLEYLMGSSDSEEEDHSGKKAYYLDPEAAEMAQELFENPDMRVLFDAARDITPDQLKAVGNMVEAMRKKEEGDFDEPC